MPFNSDRRRFVSNLAGGLLTWAIFQPAARAAPSAEPRVNASRLLQTCRSGARNHNTDTGTPGRYGWSLPGVSECTQRRAGAREALC
jgi:hypothetical protein